MFCTENLEKLLWIKKKKNTFINCYQLRNNQSSHIRSISVTCIAQEILPDYLNIPYQPKNFFQPEVFKIFDKCSKARLNWFGKLEDYFQCWTVFLRFLGNVYFAEFFIPRWLLFLIKFSNAFQRSRMIKKLIRHSFKSYTILWSA